LKFFLFRRQRTIHEITRSVTKHEPSSCGSCDFVDRAFHFNWGSGCSDWNWPTTNGWKEWILVSWSVAGV